jgi:uncharacterized protein YidB (DUF937 family)
MSGGRWITELFHPILSGFANFLAGRAAALIQFPPGGIDMSEILNQVKSMIEGQSKVVKALIEEYGGVTNFMNELKKRGIPEKAKAWLEDGKKFVLSQDQVKKLLGDERIHLLAEKLKTTPDHLATMLGEALPPILEKIELARSKLEEASKSVPADSLVGNLLKKINGFLGGGKNETPKT